MSQDKLPTSKIERASRFLKTGAKVGANYLKHYGKKAIGRESDQATLDEANATDIFEGFAELRGSALKVAQMLSMDTINFSESFTKVMSRAQYSVPPMSAPLAVQAFTKSVGKNPEQVFTRFDPNAHKAASMGQVHVAEYQGRKIAVKIQYPGVADSIKSDLNMVKSIAPRLLNTSAREVEPYFEEIQSRLLEEADYRIELQNSLEFSRQCANIPGIVFPEYLPEISSQRVICMEWLDGLHLKEFLATNPSREILQKTAQSLWDFYEYQIHHLKAVNADPHPGNFLFRQDGTIGVLDFGAVKRLSPKLYKDYFSLADPYLFEDETRARQVLLDLEIIRPNDSTERAAYMQRLFGRLINQIAHPYHVGVFDFKDDDFYSVINDCALEISKTREIRGTKEFLFINRTYYGLYSLFEEMGVVLNTACRYRNFLKKEVAKVTEDQVDWLVDADGNFKGFDAAKPSIEPTPYPETTTSNGHGNDEEVVAETSEGDEDGKAKKSRRKKSDAGDNPNG